MTTAPTLAPMICQNCPLSIARSGGLFVARNQPLSAAAWSVANMELTQIEFVVLCGVMTLLTGAIAACIKWAVDRLTVELQSLSDGLQNLRDDLHKLAERVVALELWRDSQRRRDDPKDGPAPVRYWPREPGL